MVSGAMGTLSAQLLGSLALAPPAAMQQQEALEFEGFI